jgi:hypothetical protein
VTITNFLQPSDMNLTTIEAEMSLMRLMSKAGRLIEEGAVR